jgi:outer membrane protein TolC
MPVPLLAATRVCILLMLATLLLAGGCSRSKYRVQADKEAYGTIAERNCDPRWATRDYGIELDPRSRFYDPYKPDCSPMPLDDPASHQYLQCVYGKKGWQHWLDHGVRRDLENPTWRQALDGYVATTPDGKIKLNIDSALNLAYMHSPTHQNQLETLYLSALDVTAERFRLDSQFFGGYDARYLHQGSLVPARLTFDPTLERYVVTEPFDGAESNALTVGRPSGVDPALQLTKRFATAGELLVGFANSFVFEFTGGDRNLSASLANFSFIQPLLRGAGRDIALEELTFVERALLANLRAYSQFRQGFYTQVAIGELGVIGPQRRSRRTTLTSFSGQGGLGGYLGLLQQLQQIRNNEDNLRLQRRTLDRLEAFLDEGAIDLVQVDQFRQNVENERANLLIARNNFELALDRYKSGTLGLPPDLAVELDDSLLKQFQLIPRKASAIVESLIQLQQVVGQLSPDTSVSDLEIVLRDVDVIIESVREEFASAREDLARMEKAVPVRQQKMTEDDKAKFQQERARLYAKLEKLEQAFVVEVGKLVELRAAFSDATRAANKRQTVSWFQEFLRLVEQLVLVPAQARLEALTVEPLQLDSQDAFRIALDNRLDFMNGRASLVDSWRLIQVSADALQSILDVTASGDVRTARNNPLSFRAPTANLRMGLEFDAPFTRLLERNAYRESLIEYQRRRREFIQSRDGLHLGVRQLLRQIGQLQESLEIQRRAVTIAIRRVDVLQATLSAPPPRRDPGQQAAQFNQTTVINLLSAQSSLRDTQNRLLGVWLDYYATRMRLARELGIMTLDNEGRWLELPLPQSTPATPTGAEPEELPPPPMIPVWNAPELNIHRLPPIAQEWAGTPRRPMGPAVAPPRPMPPRP